MGGSAVSLGRECTVSVGMYWCGVGVGACHVVQRWSAGAFSFGGISVEEHVILSHSLACVTIIIVQLYKESIFFISSRLRVEKRA